MKNTLTRHLALACIVSLAAASTASAASISYSVGGAPTGVSLINFDDLALGSGGGPTSGPSGSATVSFIVDAQVVTGAASGLYAPPVLSGGNGTGFGPGGTNQANGDDATHYLTSGSESGSPTASVTLSNFGGTNALLLYFGLLWGSVDDYNTLTFYNGASQVDQVLGSDINLLVPKGDQGPGGTVYININTVAAFDRVVATSSQYAFEFDNVAYNPAAVPDGGMTLVLLGSALSGLALLRRRRKA